MAFGAILVPYDGTEAAGALLGLACDAVWNGGCMVPVYVTLVPFWLRRTRLPSWYDEEGQLALDRAEALVRQRGCRADAWLVRARHLAGAIATVAHDREVDAIFWPVPGWRHPVRRLRCAVARRLVARRAHCPMLVGRWQLPVDWRNAADPAAGRRKGALP
jgi:nucleotide-binding universal stress UspA family protein